MARIRTIKPEFPQSESMGRVSRDARLLFVLLWTQADDAGRLRGSSRMLASLLFPYDDDARQLIDTWLADLEGEGCIRRYVVDGNQYIDIPKWLEHQKIDKPSKSKVPEFTEASRIVAEPPPIVREILASVREASALEGKGKEEEGKGSIPTTSDAPKSAPVENGHDEIPLSLIRPPNGDWSAALFRQGIGYLAKVTGQPPDKHRALVGKWLKTSGNDHRRVFDLLAHCERSAVADPRAWITAALSDKPAAPASSWVAPGLG